MYFSSARSLGSPRDLNLPSLKFASFLNALKPPQLGQETLAMLLANGVLVFSSGREFLFGKKRRFSSLRPAVLRGDLGVQRSSNHNFP